MRSKNIRIACVGSFLSLVTVVALHQQHHDAVDRPLSSKLVSTPALAAVENVKAPMTEVAAPAVDSSNSLLSYIARPANAAAIESSLATPSREVHYAKVDRLVGTGQSTIAQPGSRVTVSLPNGTSVPVVIENSETLGEGRYVSSGRLEGVEGTAVFAVNQGELSAVIDSQKLGAWQIRAVGDSVAQVFQTDETLVPPCAETPAVHASVLGQPASGSVGQPMPTDLMEGGFAEGGVALQGGAFAPAVTKALTIKSQVRILVPYSSKILKAVSAASVQSAIDLAIATMNTDLARSAIPVKVVLAGAVSVAYTQDGTDSSSVAVDKALTRIASATDGVLDSIHVTRGHTSADLVCFLINAVDSTNSGVGYVLRNPGDAFNPTYGFSVITYGYLNSARTFSHEIGHNFGCNHDRENAYGVEGQTPSGTYAYSYGYRFYGKDGVQYRTIMSYPPGTLTAYYSNPNLAAASPISKAVGVPTGASGQAYNALTITQNAAEVANFHNSSLLKRLVKHLGG
jgi:metallopeptidase family M12-like protein